MRALLPPESGDVDVHEWYARDWIEPGGMRVNFVSSVDGGATAAGLSRGLQTPGDNRIFGALRDLADVVIAGAGTARDENYRAVTLSDRRVAIRAGYDLPPELPVAVISASLRLDPSAELFAPSASVRTIVVTCSSSDSDARAALNEVADVIVAGDDRVDPAAMRAALAERGLTRLLCEGGPTLFAELADAGVVDELCLTISPLLAGPGARRIVAGELWPGEPAPLELMSLLEEDGALFARYRLS